MLTALCVLGLSVASQSAWADTFTGNNPNAITTPDSGPASLYPSGILLSNVLGKVVGVTVTLHNVNHTFPDDYDILLVGPLGQRAVLMSDAGGSGDVSNVTITFSDTAPPLPNGAQVVTASYRPGNYSTGGVATDEFPPVPAQTFSSSFSTFNNTNPNGTWNLYVVDDGGGDSGSILQGWSLSVSTTSFSNANAITIPSAGIANPYPSQINVSGLSGNIRRVTPTLRGITHTFPDDIDVLLIGPQSQNSILLSDAGGSDDVSGLTMSFDDGAAPASDSGPITLSGTYRPSNFLTAGSDPNDTFPPAPAQTYPALLSAFNSTAPNGIWSLDVVDDAGGDLGTISNGWSLDFLLEPTVLANISTRLRVETGDDVLIGGFIVTGSVPKTVIVRAIGPSLPLPGKLADPTLELRDGNGGLIRFNDDWRSGAMGFPSQEAEIIATGVPPTSDLEAAIIATLPNDANYTAIVRGLNNTTGIGVVEAYDLNRLSDSRLANISTRGLVQTGDNVLIAGTIVLGGTTQKVIVRAIGPSLPLAGKLADPTLELRDGNGDLIAANDDWQTDQESDIITTGVPPTNDLESAIVATLPAGGASYTAIVRGVGIGTGIAVVEVYALN